MVWWDWRWWEDGWVREKIRNWRELSRRSRIKWFELDDEQSIELKISFLFICLFIFLVITSPLHSAERNLNLELHILFTPLQPIQLTQPNMADPGFNLRADPVYIPADPRVDTWHMDTGEVEWTTVPGLGNSKGKEEEKIKSSSKWLRVQTSGFYNGALEYRGPSTTSTSWTTLPFSSILSLETLQNSIIEFIVRSLPWLTLFLMVSTQNEILCSKPSCIHRILRKRWVSPMWHCHQ